MKNDLLTSILTAVVGLVISYFVCNLLVDQMGIFGKTATYSAIESTFNSNLVDPNPDVFNYRALNPTVEVYVGNCTEFNSDGVCVDNGIDVENNVNINNDAANNNSTEMTENATEDVVEDTTENEETDVLQENF